MASHGGFIGATLAILWTLRGKSLDALLRVADIVAIPVILGLGIGRIGNFINQELYGTVTSLPWGIVIPGVEGLRHPVQLYETLTCVIIAFLCYWHLRKTTTPGRTFGLFLTFYSIVRILLEWLRIHEHPPLLIGSIPLFREQLLTIPLLLIGIVMVCTLKQKTDVSP
jgi:phosphatidylglycerol:prolipoprotein diacylglycerol transferase